MKLTGHKSIKFNGFLPIYNWIYPLTGEESKEFLGDNLNTVFSNLRPAKSRAIYIHIPFCETICSFCPFIRAGINDNLYIDEYVDALLKEIELKAEHNKLTNVPIGAIFFGGGTPSLLDPNHIRKIGQKLRNSFNLTRIREFSFEFEVKSITPEKIEALQEIGVTHARFGLQTFSPKYRKIFKLTATLDQIRDAAKILTGSFPHTSCDMLYGMNGQTEEDLSFDIESVCNLGLNNIDFYPINNLSTQTKLHNTFKKIENQPISGLTKYFMNIFIRRSMKGYGYIPHNGHGYVKVNKSERALDPVITNKYSFVYHEHVYGYPEYDLLGFGTNAVSSFSRFTLFNPSSRTDYIKSLKNGNLNHSVVEHSKTIDSCKPLALALPYHGKIQKKWLHWIEMPNDMRKKFDSLIATDLVIENGSTYELTKQGWEWYTNIMYYLLPKVEQLAVNQIIQKGISDPNRIIEPSGLENFDFSIPESIAM